MNERDPLFRKARRIGMIVGLSAFLLGSLGLLVLQLCDAWDRAGLPAFVLGILALGGAAGLLNWGLFSSPELKF